MRRLSWLPWLLLFLPAAAHAQSVAIDLGAAGQAGATARIVQLTALVTVLSLAPSLLVMVTAFTRIVIVLSLLRTALGTQGAPPNTVLIGLALFLTWFVMQPVFEQSWIAGIAPMMDNKIAELDGIKAAAEPFRGFMLHNLRGDDLSFFQVLAHAAPGDTSWRHRHAGVHGRRVAARVRDGLPAVSALPGHRHGRRQCPDESGHDDAAAQRRFVAVQTGVLRHRRWLATGVWRPGARRSS